MKKRIMWTSFAITAVALIVFSILTTQICYNNSVEYARHYLRGYMSVFDETRTVEELDALWYDTEHTWDAVHHQADALDELINAFNEESGVLKSL